MEFGLNAALCCRRIQRRNGRRHNIQCSVSAPKCPAPRNVRARFFFLRHSVRVYIDDCFSSISLFVPYLRNIQLQ